MWETMIHGIGCVRVSYGWQVGEINVGRQRYTLSLSAPLKIIIILGDQMLKKYNFILDN